MPPGVDRALDALRYFCEALDINPSAELEARAAALRQEVAVSKNPRAVPTDRASEPTVEAKVVEDWAGAERRLGPVELFDLDGRLWRTDDLMGHTVVVNVWATWCGPCRAELPHFQRLYEQLQTREDVLALSLNVDRNLGLVRPYLERQHFTFPVLLGQSYLEEIAGIEIPQTWIVRRHRSSQTDRLCSGARSRLGG